VHHLPQTRELSPNTNLRKHRAEIRKLVGSPERAFDLAAFIGNDGGPQTDEGRFFDDNFFFADPSSTDGGALDGLDGFPF
jgi:hypothetical protein